MKTWKNLIFVAIVTIFTMVSFVTCKDESTAVPLTNGGGTSIISAEITLGVPEKGLVMGKTAATTGADTFDTAYVISKVVWNPTHSNFRGGTVYTATVTLSAKSGYTFNNVLLDNITVNGEIARIKTKSAQAITLSHTFARTPDRRVSEIIIKTQPDNLTYTHNQQLSLDGLVVTLFYDDTTTEDVAATDFTYRNINTSPSQGNRLVRSTHNGQPVTITYGNLTQSTDYLTIYGASGAVVAAPTLNSVTSNSITINPVTAPSTGQSVEYGISTTNDANTVGWWQPGLTFNGLSNGTTYYIFARSRENENYNVGAASGSLEWMLFEVEMVLIPGGTFTMGSNDSQDADASPPHQVTLTGFYMGKYEVTQMQYQTVTGTNPSYFDGTNGIKATPLWEMQANRPVEYVSWYEAVEFCNKLSELEGLTSYYTISGRNPVSGYPITGATVTVNSTATGYRLPTEAQWEYAARGGNGLPGSYTYSGSNTVGDVAWYSANSDNKTHEVGTKMPNGLGLYDMSGNVWEWCWDWYGSYSSDPQTDPTGAVSGTPKVMRGGSFNIGYQNARSTFRASYNPSVRDNSIGFRVVRP